MNTVRRKVLALLMILGVVIGLSPFLLRVYADGAVLTVSQLTTVEANNINNYVVDVNTKIKDSDATGVSTDILTWKDTQPSLASGQKIFTMKFDYAVYQKLSYDEKVETMSILLNNLGDESNVSAINRTKIYNFISKNDETTSSLIRQLSSDMKSDYAGAYQYIRPFSGAVGIVLGTLTVIIFSMLSLSIVIDIGYIVIPLFQVWLNKANGQDKPRLISAEAWAAIKEGEGSVNGGDGYTSPIGFYFKFKTKQFLILGICILYLTSGKIYDLIASIMNSLNGIVG